MGEPDELFDLVDEANRVIGYVSRSQVHGNPDLRHRAVHILVFDAAKRIYLQRRGSWKLIQPGKWDSSVGGHVVSGESYEAAAKREAEEELSLSNVAVDRLFDFVIANEIETEFVRTFKTVWDGEIVFDPDEITEGRFFSREEMGALVRSGACTPSLEAELLLLNEQSD